MNDNANSKDTQEPHTNIKTEFYTREGLWKSIHNSEYTKPNNNPSSAQLTAMQQQSQSNNDQIRISFITIKNQNLESNTNCLRCMNCNKLNNITTTTAGVTCAYCNRSLKLTESTDYLMFNYSRELYLYHFNSLREQNEVKNLVDKKMYKSLAVTCHDINVEVDNSLVIAAGFSKGEVHVYDAFKKDSSQFFNNNSNEKLNDRTKATCIRWIPKSTNLFLVSHTSGHIYLYDINLNQSQGQQNPFTGLTSSTSTSSASTQAQQQSSSSMSSSQTQASQPQYQTISEGECYKIETNVAIIKNPKASSSQDTQSSNSLAKSAQYHQQQQNPLIKWSITTYNKTPCSINEFAFSPDGQYLAVACQDGYLRVFNYAEMQLKCLMKSYFGGLLCVCWSHDGKFIATGGEDDLITVYSFYEQRVACRGRGHSSWINSVQFDYWTSYYMNDLFDGGNDAGGGGDSDFEDYHQNKNTKVSSSKKAGIRQHTTSTSSNYHSNKRYSSLSDYDQMHLLSRTNIYRLGSIGQDNQIAFWDLSEDVLKERTHSRSRVTSLALNSLSLSFTAPQQPLLPPQTVSQLPNNSEPEQQASKEHHRVKSDGLGVGFLKKNKRYASLNLNKKTEMSSQMSNAQQQQQSGKQPLIVSKLNMNQLCPKLDEVPMIEPLICKRIANERLTGLLFKEDCFLVASQDGVVSTWARPDKNSVKNMISTTALSLSNEKLQQNSTSL